MQSVNMSRSCCRWRIRSSSASCQLSEAFPVVPVGGAALREHGQRRRDVLQRDADTLSDADEADPAEHVAAVPPLIAGVRRLVSRP